MNRLEWLASLGLMCVLFGAQPALADMSGTTWPEEEEEEEQEQEQEQEESAEETDSAEADEDDEEKGCSHVLRPHNLAVAGMGLLVFAVVARRDPRSV